MKQIQGSNRQWWSMVPMAEGPGPTLGINETLFLYYFVKRLNIGKGYFSNF